ncbi:hypothetical protein QYE76_049754 [Lolium multiflorum]|uniref:Retrotransposon gag domain-containing protein n=1 Tax=Lolium multiflorum TaxID=4521 RepID=A0AAD8SPH7_LOLMU|nr:hypothetical protein QYE76_049754 [Lolium multiflorum]
MTEGARRGKRGPRWAQTTGRRGPWPGRATCGVGAPRPLRLLFFAYSFVRKPKPQRVPHEEPPLRGGEHQREKSSGGQNPGKFPPEGKSIAIVIELDIISIIIIIISTIYTANTTAAPRHRCIAMNEVRKKLFTISLSGKAAHWYKLLKNGDSIDWEDIVPLFYSKFYPPSEIHKDRNRIYNFWPHDGESIAQAWGRLKSLMLKCPIHELPGNVIIDNFYARLSFQDKTLLDTSCSGSFTRNKEEFKRDLLDRIQENTEGWENDKDRESAMTRCSGGDGGVDGGDDDDDDGDDVPLDDDGDGVDFPLREGISPADSCPPESSFLSGVLRPAEAAVTLREVPSVA